MFDTSHSTIGPCQPSGQSPFGDNFRHASTALLRPGLDSGEKAGARRGGVGWERGETVVGLTSKIWDSYNSSESRFILCKAGFGFARDWGCAFAHPPLQEFSDMLTMSIRNRIQSREGKKICAYMCIDFVICICVRACLFLLVSA